LSQGASEQASSLEEISSTMEEIAGNVSNNTSNAQQTAAIATKSSTGIKEVSEAAKGSLDAVNDIATKISVINDIAFQTNILALNAAVEAARAGEYGRGFAVVAGEVRKLAELSKKAADDIVVQANNSVEVTQQAGGKMFNIIPEIEKTAHLTEEISAASMEQSNGVDQVNNAIQQLNHVTQQNATVSEEMASSSEEMSSQAQNLKDMIAYFKL
jgi:methyl-accepting chemotaxis protein